MKLLKYLFILNLLFSCSSKEEVNEESKEFNKNSNVVISGKITGAVNQPIVLEYVDAQGNKELAKSSVKENGEFELQAFIPEIGIYQLKLGLTEGKVIPLTIVPKDKVIVEAEFQTFERLPVITGTSWSKNITDYMKIFNEFASNQMTLMNNKELDENAKIEQFLKLRKPLDDFANVQILKDPSNPANIVLSTSLTPAMGFQYWNENYLITLKKVTKAYNLKYKNAAITNSMLQQTMEIEAAHKDYKLLKSGKKTAPEISLNNPDGKEIKLSSLKGQVVLIDFWASWCGPCRKENPNVVALYNKYKAKGFTVYSVSLDKDANAWKEAIKADGLLWPNHVSDLKQWQTPLTQIYNFNSIPFTVLVDRKGNIVETNLRGQLLEQKLIEIL